MKYFNSIQIFLITSIAISLFQEGCVNNTPSNWKLSLEKNYTENVNEWSSVSFPKYDSPEAWAANYSRNEWDVYSDNGIIKAKPYDPKKEIIGQKPPFKIPDSSEAYGWRKYTLHVADGWIIGYNAGEFGGSLWWFSEDGERKYKISDDQINLFLRASNCIYGFEGVAHLTISEGSIVNIVKDKNTNKWYSKSFVKLNKAPDAAALKKDGSMIVVTTSELVEVSPLGNLKILASEIEWGTFYPNSIVLDSKYAYIGMRQGIARVSLKYPLQIDWLVPSQKFLNEDLKRVEKLHH